MKQNVVVLRGGKFQAGAQVVGLKEGIIGQNFLPVRAMRQQLKNVFYAHPIPADAGPPSALAGLDGDSGKKRVHNDDCVASPPAGNLAERRSMGSRRFC